MTAVLAFALKTDITVYVVVGDYYVNLRGDARRKKQLLYVFTRFEGVGEKLVVF